MRKFKDGDTIVIEPWRAAAFPVIRDCAVDRTAFDRIIAAGGFVSVNTGAAPEASTIPVPKADADRAFDAAACIGCGACVAAFVSRRRQIKICRRRRELKSYWRLWSAFRLVRSL